MDSTFAQKPEFTERVKSQLAEINQSLDQLEAKIEKSSHAAKAAAKPKLQALREKANQLKKTTGGGERNRVHLGQRKNRLDAGLWRIEERVYPRLASGWVKKSRL